MYFRKYSKIRYVGILTLLIVLIGLQVDRQDRMEVKEMVFFNSRITMLSVKTGSSTTCFHTAKESDLRKVKFLMESYAKVKPGTLNYVKLAEGKTKIKSKEGIIEITAVEGSIYVLAQKKTYFLRTKYSEPERIVDQIIDLPYLAEGKSNYNLKNGAFSVEL